MKLIPLFPGFPEHQLEAAPGTCWRDNNSKHTATLSRKVAHLNLLLSAESSLSLRDLEDRGGLGAAACSCRGRWMVITGLGGTGCILMSSRGRGISCDLFESMQGRIPLCFQRQKLEPEAFTPFPESSLHQNCTGLDPA